MAKLKAAFFLSYTTRQHNVQWSIVDILCMFSFTVAKLIWMTIIRWFLHY